LGQGIASAAAARKVLAAASEGTATTMSR
jgi:hypothetical protein